MFLLQFFPKLAGPLQNLHLRCQTSTNQRQMRMHLLRSKTNVTVLSNLSEVFQALASKVVIVLPDMLRQLMALVQEWLKSGNHLDLDPLHCWIDINMYFHVFSISSACNIRTLETATRALRFRRCLRSRPVHVTQRALGESTCATQSPRLLWFINRSKCFRHPSNP